MAEDQEPEGSVVVAVSPSALRMPLPPLPSGFERELAGVGSIEGKPLFKVVDGQRELKFRNGKMDIKHLLQSDKFPCYVPVVTEVFRRQIGTTGEYVRYATATDAKRDNSPELGEQIEMLRMLSTRAVGRACWIIEVLVTPEDVNETAWNESRYQYLNVMGVPTKTDVLGEFPKDGMYVYCFSVLGDDGEAVAPNSRTIQECKKRWQAAQSDKIISNEKETEILEDKLEEFEKRQITRVADSFYQYHGISARRMHGGAISKPISQVYAKSA